MSSHTAADGGRPGLISRIAQSLAISPAGTIKRADRDLSLSSNIIG
jgi:hypothetical protein